MKTLVLLLSLSLTACAAGSAHDEVADASRRCGKTETSSGGALRDATAEISAAIDRHRTLRAALGAPMPQAPTMILLHGSGGHLETTEYSIVAWRTPEGKWAGTAVGRSKIWVASAPFRELEKRDWEIAAYAGMRIEQILADPCFYAEPVSSSSPDDSPPPPRATMAFELATVTPNERKVVRYPGGYTAGLIGEIDRLVRPAPPNR